MDNKTERRFSFLALSFYIFLSFLVLSGVLLRSGTLGARSDWAFPVFSDQLEHFAQKSAFSIDPFSGRLASFQSVSFLLNGILGSLGYLGLEGDLVSKAFCLSALVISGISSFFLCREMDCSYRAAFVGGFFYSFSPVMFNQFVIGHFTYLFSYSIAPFVLALFSRYTKVNFKFSKAILIGLLFAISWTQLQFSVMLFGVLFLYCLLGRSWKSISVKLKTLSIATLIAIGSHSPWIITSVFSPLPSSSVAAAFSRGDLVHMSGSILDVIRLQAFPVGGSFREFFPGPLTLLSFIFPLLAFLAICFRPRDKTTLYFSLLAVIGLFFGQGVNPPLGFIVEWLFVNVKYMAIFREIYHFAFIPALAYSVLIAISTDTLRKMAMKLMNKMLTTKAFLHVLTVRVSLKIFKPDFIIMFIIILFLSLSVWPIFTGDFNGQLQVYNLNENHHDLYNFLESLNETNPVFYLPATSASFTNYSIYTYPLRDTQRDPMMAFSPVPYFDGDGDIKYSRFSAFLDRTVALRKTKYFGQLLGSAGGKYLISREDVRSRYFYPDPWNQSTVLEGLSNVELSKSFGNICVFSNSYAQPLVYTPESLAFAAGDLSILWYLSYLSDFKKEQLPTLLFTADLSDGDMQTLEPLVDTIILSDGDYLEYVFAHISSLYKISPTPYSNFRLRQEGWTAYGNDWSDSNVFTSLYDGVITLVPDVLNVPFSCSTNEEYELWARVYFGTDASSLSFSLDGQDIMNIETNNLNHTGLSWVPIGNLSLDMGRHVVSARSGIGKNMIDQFLICPSSDVNRSFQESAKEINQKNLIILIKPYPITEGSFVASQMWGIDSSGGYLLRTNRHGKIELPLSVPITGDYQVYLRSGNLTSFSKISIMNNSDWDPLADKVEESRGNEIEIANLDSWSTIKSSIAFSDYSKDSNLSLCWSFTINKTANEDHTLNLEFPPEDWSGFDQIGFWIFPERIDTEFDTQVFFHLKNTAVDWVGGQQYLPNNKWSYVTFDLTNFSNRTNINLIRFLVGDSWGEYSEGENVTFYISNGSLEKIFRNQNLVWSDLGQVEINQDRSTVMFESSGTGTALDLVVLEHSASGKSIIANSLINFSEISPVNYEIDLFSSEPTFLFFCREFNSGWTARVDGTELAHFKGNSFGNLYYLDKTGYISIEITFDAEPYYQAGLQLSVIVIVLSLVIVSWETSKKLLRKIHSKSRFSNIHLSYKNTENQ